LATLDAEISRSKAVIGALITESAFSTLRSEQRDFAAALITSRNELDTVELEISRAETDLHLVEQRIKRDEERLNQTQSSKDAQGIQSELATLAKRKSDLEDFELEVLERKDAAAAAFAVVLEQKTELENRLAKLEAENEAAIMKLRSGLDLTVQARAKQAANIPAELLELFEKKASRGIPVGKLNGRECGACRISLGATAYNEISVLARDEIATCPDCQAILVR
jgi:predicted  nucleic acid-binding Zn-ribbon protein